MPPYIIPKKYRDFAVDDIAALATANGWTYVPQSPGDSHESSLYNNPVTQTTELYKLRMDIDGLQCEYYAASLIHIMQARMAAAFSTIAPQSESPTQVGMQVQVFSIELPYVVENLYVESRTNITLNNILGLHSVVFKHADSPKLEGDFSRFFTTFVPNGEELNAFLILAPNIMVELLRDGGDYDFEFSGRKIYFYQTFGVMTGTHIPMKRRDYDHMLQFGVRTARKLVRASRPAQLPRNTTVPEMWELYGSTGKQSVEIVAIIFGIVVVFACIVIPLLWPVAIAIGAIVLAKYYRLKRKRAQLLERWGTP